MTVGPMVFGLVVDVYSLDAVFYSGGIFGLLVTIVCYVFTTLPVTAPQPSVVVEKEPVVAD